MLNLRQLSPFTSKGIEIQARIVVKECVEIYWAEGTKCGETTPSVRIGTFNRLEWHKIIMDMKKKGMSVNPDIEYQWVRIKHD